MKTLLTIALVTLLITGATSALALGPLDASAELGVFSKYVWRGIVVNPETVLQPDLNVSFLGFGLDIWANMDLTDQYEMSGEFNEVDYTLYYELPLPLVDLGAGFIYYDFPNTEYNSTTEFYISAAVNVILSPSLAVYQDIDQIKGAYWEAGISHGLELSPGLSLDLGANLGLGSKGYMNGYFGVIPDPSEPLGVTAFTSATMSNFLFTADLPWHPLPIVTITPSAAYSTLLGDAKDSVDLVEGDTDAFYVGLTAALAF